MREVAIVGASGLVGHAVMSHLIASNSGEIKLTAVSRRPQQRLLDDQNAGNYEHRLFKDISDWSQFSDVIYAAGVSDHGLGDRDPKTNWSLTLDPLFILLASFRGRFTLISSQAVYSGLQGLVSESTTHVPVMPYGLSKLHAEQVLESAFKRGLLSSLEIFRLMYTYGVGERPTRLLPAAINSVVTGKPVKIIGGGRSFINPLPVGFVGQVIAESTMINGNGRNDEARALNICHSDAFRVLDALEILTENFNALFEVSDEPEAWPVFFRGETSKLTERLESLGLELPPIVPSIVAYGEQLMDAVKRR